MSIRIHLIFSFFLLNILGSVAQHDESKLSLIIDADSANELDDLFAIVRALGEPRFNLLGITSAQFHTSPYASENTALESQKINEKLMELLPMYAVPLLMGNGKPLQESNQASLSSASKFIIDQARSLPQGQKLDLVILGSCTNAASALLEAPEIASKLRISYIGFWHDPETNEYNKKEFNTGNDPIATEILLNFNGLEIQVMTATTCQNLIFDKVTSFSKLRSNPLGKFLMNRWKIYKRWWTDEDPEQNHWIMWDLALIEALINPGFAEKKSFQTPPENNKRVIQIYTSIDSLSMKVDFWQHFKTLTQ